MPRNTFEPQARTALQKAVREAQSDNTFRRILADYGFAAVLTLCYGYMAWLEDSSGSILFFGILTIPWCL
jgi:hypothetical protein